MRVVRVLFAFSFAVALAGCQAAPEPAKQAAPPPSPVAQPYGTLMQVMRTIPFPNSNIIFDTQTNDPGTTTTKGADPGKGASTTAVYAGVYTGWPAVEAAAVALSETANLIMLPGRLCDNGKPVPIDQEAFRKAAQGLADAGTAALKAAQSKNLDAMVEVSGTIADACAACHTIYRDQPAPKERCIP